MSGRKKTYQAGSKNERAVATSSFQFTVFSWRTERVLITSKTTVLRLEPLEVGDRNY